MRGNGAAVPPCFFKQIVQPRPRAQFFILSNLNKNIIPHLGIEKWLIMNPIPHLTVNMLIF